MRASPLVELMLFEHRDYYESQLGTVVCANGTLAQTSSRPLMTAMMLAELDARGITNNVERPFDMGAWLQERKDAKRKRR